MKRREFVISLPGLLAARQAMAASGVKAGRLGMCTFSCHLAWQKLHDATDPAPFTDAPTFFDYARHLGADGVQTSLGKLDPGAAARLREQVDKSQGYLEGDIRLPKQESELDGFEQEVKITRATGASVARTVLSGSRRYETWKTLDEFKAFHEAAPRRLAWVEPILKRHRLRLAVENHKDLTSDELARLMRQMNSEWIGVNVDTGNNIALLEDPRETIEALAPFVMSVHLKDMAVQPDPRGFQLSEVVCGRGFLDLPRITRALNNANGNVCFSLEMATRDPLLIPCLTDAYFATFPGRKDTHLAAALQRMKANPPKYPPPSVTGKPMPQQLAEEEFNNRRSLDWMHQNLLLS